MINKKNDNYRMQGAALGGLPLAGLYALESLRSRGLLKSYARMTPKAHTLLGLTLSGIGAGIGATVGGSIKKDQPNND